MGLNLRIENEARLPDGGPLAYELSGDRGADIGRDAHLDWTLPDPARHVSGKHCEIRFEDGGYWLKDVSTNGTFLNGSLQRMQSPYRLKSGDRLLIGHYIVAVEVSGANLLAPNPAEAPPEIPFDAEDLWGGAVGAAEPSDPRDFRPASQFVPVKPDFLEWAVDVPDSPGSGFVARPIAAAALSPARLPEPGREGGEPFSWDAGSMPTPEPIEPPSPLPTPRRSIWVGPGPDGPWTSGEKDAPPLPGQPLKPVSSDIAAREATPPAAPAASAVSREVGGDVVVRFARGAGVSADALASRDIGEFAEWVGRLMLLVTENVKQMLDARGQTKRITRSSNQTMIAALDNNPLKFSPSAADALRIMLGPPTRSYLGAEQALQQGFDDLKAHQMKTFSAMQRALTLMVEDLDPQTIQKGAEAETFFAGLFRSRRARAWAIYEARWQSKFGRQGGGLQDAFMQCFSECYDRATGTPSEPR